MNEHSRKPVAPKPRPAQAGASRMVSDTADGQLSQLQALADESSVVQRLQGLQPVASPPVDPSQLANGKNAHLRGKDTRPLMHGQRQMGKPVQRKKSAGKKERSAGATAGRLPRDLQSGMEHLSGISLDDVRVHHNSSAPSQVGAYAFAQGRDIHLGPGQERHLPHEAWHVVQQAQGRVRPTLQAAGLDINDDVDLEREAERMGARAASMTFGAEDEGGDGPPRSASPVQAKPVVQRLAGLEVELRIPFYGNTHGVPTDDASFISTSAQSLVPWARTQVVDFLYGGLQYGTSYGSVPGHFDISADHTGWRQTHMALREHIQGMHIANPGGPQPSMSNLEYRTTALEERDDTSDATMRAIADEVKDHAEQSAARAQSGNSASLGPPVTGQFTGIPVAPLRSLLAGDAAGLALFNTMNNALDPSLYYQTTVGSLPSEIPDLFEEGAADIEAKKGVGNPKAGLLRHSVAQADAALNSVGGAAIAQTLEPGHKAALLGWMTLVAEYLLAYQLEVSSYRYRVDRHHRLVRKSGTEKNLVPYMSKTVLTATLAALPAPARPNVSEGPDRNNWNALMDVLYTVCEVNHFNLITTLGLTDYSGQTYYDEAGAAQGTVQHGEIFGPLTAGQWHYGLLRDMPAGRSHVRSGNELTLDDGQEHLAPELSIPGEQAIPLEDRASQAKASFGNKRDIAHANDRMMEMWTAAKYRRIESTALRTAYRARHAEIIGFFAGYGTVIPLVPALNALHGRATALPANPANLHPSVLMMNALTTDLGNWLGANPDEEVALGLLRPLINNPNWSSKGRAVLGKKTPRGIRALRTELAAGNTAAVTLGNLGAIAIDRLATGGSRAAVTRDMYNLLYQTPNWIGTPGGWTNFVNSYNRTNGAV